MMHDDDQIPADLRALFAAERGRDDGPPAGAKERVASALSITLGIGIGAAATAATSAAGATMGAGASGAASTTAAAATTAAATTAAATTAVATTTAASVAAGTGATTAAGAGFTATGGALAKGLAFVFATAVAGTTGTGIYLAAKDDTKPAIVEVAPSSADVPSSFDPKMLGKKAPPPVVEKPKPPIASVPFVSAPVVEVERAAIAPVENTPEAKAERLRGERAVLDTARAAVARGDGGAALIALEAHRASYADGALVEERDALTILALAKVGRTDEARKKADAFRAKKPHSLFLKAIDGALR